MSDSDPPAPPPRNKRRKPRPVYISALDIEVVRRQCTGVMTCMEQASRTFDLDEDAVAIVINPNGNSDDDILAAAKSCPMDAIVLRKKGTGEQIWPLD